MKLYVANPTRQTKKFYFRLDFDKQGESVDQKGVLPRMVEIKPGRQEPVGGDLAHKMVADSIVRQLKRYGAIDVSDVNRMVRYTDYVFSYDRPVPKNAIDKALRFNSGLKTAEGRKRRELAAITTQDLMQADETRVSMEQLDTTGTVDRDGPMLAEGYDVDSTRSAEEVASLRGKTGLKPEISKRRQKQLAQSANS